MPIERFTLEDFRQFLVSLPPHRSHNMRYGEGQYVADIYIDRRTMVRIYTSIASDGVARDTAQDSIRLFLVSRETDTLLSKLSNAYVTRMPGWQERLSYMVGTFFRYRELSGDCPKCGHPMFVFRTTEKLHNRNYGRLFTSCFNCRNTFRWLEDADGSSIPSSRLPAAYFQEPRFEVFDHSSDLEEADLYTPGSDENDPVQEDEDAESAAQHAGDLLEQLEALEYLEGNDDDDEDDTRAEDHAVAVEASSAVEVSEVFSEASTSAVEASEASTDAFFDALDDLEETEQPQPIRTSSDDRQANAEQLEAILQPLEAAVRVLAPPGSGKTFLLVRRIKHLVDSGVPMSSILAVAFNVKMAEELRSRFTALYGLDYDRDTLDLSTIDRNICTIHAACARMLREGGDRRTVPERDMWRIKDFVQKCAQELWPDEATRPNHKEILDWIYALKNHGVWQNDIAMYYRKSMPDGYAEGMTTLHTRFDEWMKANNFLMFGDMLYDVENLLVHNDAFRSRWQAHYKYIVVDEGQDVNGQAMRILTTLAYPEDRFFIVGDPDQLMYRFTGATPEKNLFEGFDNRFPNGVTVMLATNYRSVRRVIDATTRLIEHNYSQLGGPYDLRFFKNVRSRPDADAGHKVTYVHYPDQDAEALALVSAIEADLADDGFKPDHIFVGARTRAQLAYLEGTLMRSDIPYVNTAGLGFWDSRHIGDLIAFVRLAQDEHDDDAFKRIYNIATTDFVHPFGPDKGSYCPHHYLGRQFLEAAQGQFRNVRVAVRAYKWPWKYTFRDGSEDLVQFITELQYVLQQDGVAGTLEYILSHSYREYMIHELGVRDDADGTQFEDIAMLIDIAAQFGKDTLAFLDFIAKAVQRAQEAAKGSWEGKVVLSTIHGLKGLERPLVYGIGLCEGTRQTEFGEEPIGLLPHTFSLTAPPNTGVLPGSGQGRLEDERCVAFVLVSRAAERVRLSGFSEFRNAFLVPSRFVNEMGAEVL